MAVIMTEADLQRLGFQVDPDNPSQAVPVKSDELPDDSWAFERLMTYGAAAANESTRLDHEATCLARRSTIHIYRAGRALSLARKKLPPGQSWGECLRVHDIPRTNAWEAIQLFERAGSEEAVALLIPTEAKQVFGITKPKKPSEDEESESPSTVRFPGTSDDDLRRDDPCTSDDEDLEGDLEGLDSDEVANAVDETELDNLIPDEAENSEPPDHEPESVLRLLVKVNAALGLAASMPVADEDSDQIETEIIEAHKLLDEIEAGV